MRRSPVANFSTPARARNETRQANADIGSACRGLERLLRPAHTSHQTAVHEGGGVARSASLSRFRLQMRDIGQCAERTRDNSP